MVQLSPPIKTETLTRIYSDFTAKIYMELLTGWSLIYEEDISIITLRNPSRFSSATKIERPQVMLWSKGDEIGLNVQLLVRLSEGDKDPWLSMSCER